MTDSDDVKKNQRVAEQADGRGKGTGKKEGWFLSPPVWVMVAGLVLIFALNFFCIIKVMTLEIEKNILKQKETALQADIERHTDILQSLPSLESQRGELKKHIVNLQGKLSDLIRRETELIQNIETRKKELHTAVAQRSQADAAAMSARKETGRLQSEISAKESKKGTLEITVEKLRQDEVRQKAIAETLASKVQSLQTDIDILNRTKEKNLLELEGLTRDNKRLAKVNTDLVEIAKAMDESRKMADAAVNVLKETTAKAKNAVVSLETHAQTTEKTVQGLTRADADLSGLMESMGNEKNLLKTAITDLGEAGTEAGKQVKRLSRQLNAPIENLNKDVATLSIHTEAVGEYADVLAVIQEKITSSEKDFTSVTRKLESSQIFLGQEVNLLQKEKIRLGGSLSEFEISVHVAENTMALLKKTALDLGGLDFTEKRLAIQKVVDELSVLQQQMEIKQQGVGELMEKFKQSVDSANVDVGVLHAGALKIESGGQKLTDTTMALNHQVEAVKTAVKNLNELMEQNSPMYIFRPENSIVDSYRAINEHKEQSK
ncbi:hypothetical protein SAMN02746065_10649 [Desulfocicer vacuolatum DSM 3385]|uniref:Uncharacterized protein n=1 Tax=Desulfocicer vacuolatum DSM 3385 TaxID=1121400 RepID=A0A1W2ARV1_9BACT|nr:hypothetical protein [Desulfocicer vacuolatum]SMC63314.1 hypothetical protein SAMN02746065_10649 [Desulfocicer vacuolatum DSM 3385]